MRPPLTLLALAIALLSASLLRASPTITELQAQAEKGSPLAQLELGDAYFSGNGVPTDHTEAVRWFRKAAEQGLDTAQLFLGVAYAGGDGIAQDMSEATKWIRKAAEQGEPAAQYRLGFAYDNGITVPKDPIEAVKWYRKAADQGNADGQFELGRAYGGGMGVSNNLSEAAAWTRKAANQGHAEAQCLLGMLYQGGNGVPKDQAEALKWYRKAAEQDNGPAQYCLGLAFVLGKGVPKDEIEALAWFNISAASGGKMAIRERDGLESSLGHQATLLAQQRSQEILKEIAVTKAHKADSKPSSVEPDADHDTPKSSGSGAIVSAQGIVLTAAHVVTGAKNILVVTVNGKQAATVLKIDDTNDVAVLKIGGGPYAPLPIAASRSVRLGQTVATIGFPNIVIQGFSPKVTRGEISSMGGAGDDPRSWQVSVPVQSGNSGGPLLDENGNLIGIVVSKLGIRGAEVTGDIPQNVNYALKSAYALALLEPYMDSSAPEPKQPSQKQTFADMVSTAQQSTVLIIVY